MPRTYSWIQEVKVEPVSQHLFDPDRRHGNAARERLFKGQGEEERDHRTTHWPENGTTMPMELVGGQKKLPRSSTRWCVS